VCAASHHRNQRRRAAGGAGGGPRTKIMTKARIQALQKVHWFWTMYSLRGVT
jgi:hypothetical protein